MQGVSGHKHIDIKHAITNNPELLFRFLIDVENESFLTKALGREYACKEYFPYLFMNDTADLWKMLIDSSVELINKKITCEKTLQPTTFYTWAHALECLLSLKGHSQPA